MFLNYNSQKTFKGIVCVSGLLGLTLLGGCSSPTNPVSKDNLVQYESYASILAKSYGITIEQAQKNIEKELEELDRTGPERLKRDQDKIKEAIKNGTAKDLYPIEYQEYQESLKNNSSKSLKRSQAASLGIVGDILVSYDKNSSGIPLGLPGHAAIVDIKTKRTIESWPQSSTHSNGVQYCTNDWGDKEKVYGISVMGAGMIDRQSAVAYCVSKIGCPYNFFLYDYKREDTFYCSQLVWRAWFNQG